MAVDVMNLFTMAFTAVVGWVHRVIVSAELSGIYFGALAVWLSVKYLISPIIFNAGSDKAKAHSVEA